MKKFTIILGIILFGLQSFGQWAYHSKTDEFKNSTGEYYAESKNEIKQNGRLVFTIVTRYDYPEDTIQTQEPYTFYMFTKYSQDYFVNSNNCYLSVSDGKEKKHRINLKKDGATAHVTLEDTEKFTDLLKINSKIKCILVDNGQRQYMWTINCMGFTKSYNKVKTTSKK